LQVVKQKGQTTCPYHCQTTRIYTEKIYFGIARDFDIEVDNITVLGLKAM